MEIVLDGNVLHSRVKSRFHLEIADILLDTLASVPDLAYTAAMMEGCQESEACVRIVPVSCKAASIEVDFLRRDQSGVALAAGHAASWHIPVDLWGEYLADPLAFIRAALSAIFRGDFEEKLYRRRGEITRNVALLRLGKREPFLFDRRNVSASIRGIGGSLEESSITYGPYVVEHRGKGKEGQSPVSGPGRSGKA